MICEFCTIMHKDCCYHLKMNNTNTYRYLRANLKEEYQIEERFECYEGPTQQEEIWSDEVVGKEEI